MFSIKLLLLFISFQYIYCDETYAIQFTSETFPQEIKKKSNFVMFYAPWCGHCQRLEPTWELLAEMLNEDEHYNIRIAKIDCTVEKDLCFQHDITGYPTLKLFKEGSVDGKKFKGTRDLQSMTSFLTDELGSIPSRDEISDSNSLQTVNGLTELTEDSFDKHIAEGKHFVKFYAPWCGHCQKLAPTWEQLAQALEHDNTIDISKVDCTQHKSVCNQFDIKGYPTLLWIEDGKKIDKYQGQRNHEELKSYVNRMMGNNEIKSTTVPSGEASSSVLVLSGDDFDHGVSKGVCFVKFFAPWCGHCKRLAPTWEDLGKKFVTNHNVHIVKVDCTADSSKQLCSEQEVDGFPTLLLYKNGEKITEYRGTRSLDDLLDFVNKYVSHDEL